MQRTHRRVRQSQRPEGIDTVRIHLARLRSLLTSTGALALLGAVVIALVVILLYGR
jgi:hypothetical protein